MSRDDHRQRMIERRRRQLARVPGFHHMPNKRLDAAFGTAFASTLESMTKAGADEGVAIQFAYRAGIGTLPVLAIGRRHSAPRPSKSDDRLYRNPALRPCRAA